MVTRIYWWNKINDSLCEKVEVSITHFGSLDNGLREVMNHEEGKEDIYFHCCSFNCAMWNTRKGNS